MELTFELGYALDTFYFLINTVLIMLCPVALVLFRQGLADKHQDTGIFNRLLITISISFIAYAAMGYSLMYGGSDFTWYLSDIEADGATGVTDAPATYAPSSDFLFQMPYALLTAIAAVLSLSNKFTLLSTALFSILTTLGLFSIYGSWTWGGESVFGLFNLGDLGFSDFAGSTVVCTTSALAALTSLLVQGPRRQVYAKEYQSHQQSLSQEALVASGVIFFVIGWMGFTGGSVLATATVESANAVAVVSLNTSLAIAGGLACSSVISAFMLGVVSNKLMLVGLFASAAAIAAEPSTISPAYATALGAIVSAFAIWFYQLLARLAIDDPIGLMSGFLVGGLLGTLLVPMSNENTSFSGQFIGIAVIAFWVVSLTGIYWLVGRLFFKHA